MVHVHLRNGRVLQNPPGGGVGIERDDPGSNRISVRQSAGLVEDYGGHMFQLLDLNASFDNDSSL